MADIATVKKITGDVAWMEIDKRKTAWKEKKTMEGKKHHNINKRASMAGGGNLS